MSERTKYYSTEKCPKCGSRAIQIGVCSHGNCLSCGTVWDYNKGELIE